MTIVYGSPISPFVRKVLIFLEEKNVTYTNIAIPPHADNADFQAISVLGEIPAFQDEQVAISDSTVICQYLEKRYAEPHLIPREDSLFAKSLWLNEYATNYFSQAILKPYTHHLIFPKILRREFDKAVGDEALAKDIPECFSYLESQLTSTLFIHEQITLADISIVSFLQCFILLGHIIEPEQYPKLNLFYITMSKIKSVDAVMRLTTAALGLS